MTDEKPPKRFIAGAVCTSCGVQDRTLMYHSDARVVRECVACGFIETLDEMGQPSELQTRVSPKPVADDSTTVIKIIEP